MLRHKAKELLLRTPGCFPICGHPLAMSLWSLGLSHPGFLTFLAFMRKESGKSQVPSYSMFVHDMTIVNNDETKLFWKGIVKIIG